MATGSPRRRPLPLLLLLFLLLFAVNGSANGARPSPIKNVVVLALENRSFDHMLGWMRRLLGLPVDGLTGAECNPNSNSTNSTSSICVSSDADLVVPDDPGHSFEDVLEQVFGNGNISAAAAQPSMSGFVRSALSVNALLSSAVMRAFRPSLLPRPSPRWSPPSPSSTAGSPPSRAPRSPTGCSSTPPPPAAPSRTTSSTSSSATRSAPSSSPSPPTATTSPSTSRPSPPCSSTAASARSATPPAPSTATTPPSRTTHAAASSPGALRHRAQVLRPHGDSADDDHPAHDVANGQRLVKDVYEALRASPQWNQTLLIVTYDEHGGFYDHVATPTAGVPSPDGIRGPPPFFFKFDRLGVRVPTIMVSPWIKKGTVVGRAVGPTDTSEFEHSSIPATIKKIFNLSSDFLTKRDAWAGTFEHIFTELDQPRTDCPETLPEVPFERPTPPKEHGWLSDFQRELVELASFLNGDYMLTSLAQESRKKKMTVKQADAYVRRAITSFLQASKQAVRLGANESAIVTMRSSLTSKSSSSSSP
ncbi:unnamed protein product [Miscanthus lutarioriparius]|uniref:Uncharacterized protein n=1 Tax=Miscanthus lutarioriparius TaxID=422564 RepID=A0A811P492_9POAL|nr:unnamed protein product [Miscanthus lutarioriparius]